jgi:cobalt-zinc-cadmium resistance protein CzcA
LQLLLNTTALIVPEDTVLTKINYISVFDSVAVTQNPSLGYMQQQVDITQNEKKIERSRLLPDLNIGYFSQTMQGNQEVNGIARTFGPDDRFTGIQAGIAVPLWFVPYTSRTKAAKINENIAKINAEAYQKSLTGSYRSLLDEYSKYLVSVNYYEQQAIPEADIIIEQSDLSYKAGAMDYIDYILNLNRALDIRQNYLDALNNLNQTIINIEFIIGKTF